MPRITVELRTNANGFFTKTVPYNPPGPFALTVRLSATLVSPFATGLWGTLAINSKDGKTTNPRKVFVAWHKEVVPLGPWRLVGGDNIVVVHGFTRPKRPNAQLVLQVDASV